MSILLTGSNGFVGQYIESSLDCKHLSDEEGDIDVCDQQRMLDLFKRGAPDYVIHLAAQSFVPASFENPIATYEVNFRGTYNLLDALERSGFTGRFLYIGSSEVYGLVPEHEQPIVEARQLAPRNPYSVSKVAAEALCYQYSQTSSFDCIMARPFNHIGPNQSSRFVVSDFAKQLVEIKAGLREPILNVGDIDVSRDFTDVRDVVSSYLQLLKHGRNSEVYNVCSGTAITIREIIEIMVNVLGIDVVIQKDVSRFRKAEQKIVCGKAVKIRDELGWAPTISIHQSIEDILNYWEKKINE